MESFLVNLLHLSVLGTILLIREPNANFREDLNRTKVMFVYSSKAKASILGVFRPELGKITLNLIQWWS